MIATFTSPGSMPFCSRSCAESACSGCMWIVENCARKRPRFCFGSVATEGWKPVSMIMGPTPGCSTRNATIGSLIVFLRSKSICRTAPPFPFVMAMNSGGESM